MEDLPPRYAQTSPGWVSLKTDSFWKKKSRSLVTEIQKIRPLLYKKLIQIGLKIESPLDLVTLDQPESSTEATYGQLPEVVVDSGYGAVFPIPISKPGRFSWFQVYVSSQRLLNNLNHQLQDLEALEKKSPKKAYEAVLPRWNESSYTYVTLAGHVRYLEAWVTYMTDKFLKGRDAGETDFSEVLVRALFRADAKDLNETREFLRPHRTIGRSFLPDDLSEVPYGVLVLPIATDVEDRKFRAEVEGALDTHWNQSSWAIQNRISFLIEWKLVPADKRFAQKKINLEQHLAYFPETHGVITTGALTTRVQDRALILGPGKITPRTLAHEMGHLMGFEDCYLRTLTGQGVFGVGILEWDNPIYPDDIMCDNNVGEPRVEVW